MNDELLIKKQTKAYLKQLEKINSTDFFIDTIKTLSGQNADLGAYHFSDSHNEDDPVQGANGWAKACVFPYYPLGQEKEALLKYADKIADILEEDATIIDYGVGDDKGLYDKTLPIIKALKNPSGYVALDYNRNYTNKAVKIVSEARSDIKDARSIAGNFFLWKPEELMKKPVGYFLGGTIGNIVESRDSNDRANLIKRLKKFRETLGDNSFFIVSQDTNQSQDILDKGYDLELFGKWQTNIFHRMIRDLGAKKFDPDAFKAKHEWRKNEYCYALCAVATKDQNDVQIGSETINIKKGQIFDMTRSYKYPPEIFQNALKKSGWMPKKTFFSSYNVAFHICRAF